MYFGKYVVKMVLNQQHPSKKLLCLTNYILVSRATSLFQPQSILYLINVRPEA